MSDRLLFQTVIGSHVWNMNVEGSDTDYFECYQRDTRNLLRGGTMLLRSEVVKTEKTDTQKSEVGKVVHELIKNNLNYIVNTMSPIVKRSSGEHEALKAFFPRLVSKQLYYSFHGMAVHNLKLYRKWYGSNIPERSLNKVARVLQLGIRLLDGGDVVFASYHEATEHTVEKMIVEIDERLKTSPLPETCPVADKMLDWLVELRIGPEI